MAPPQKTRELARSLVASEADAAPTSLHTEPATVRVYEKLRRQLGAPVGPDGFQALASRALALAKSESPRLRAVQVTANGGLRGLGEVESQADAGEATTLRLIEDLRLQVEVRTESAATTANATQSAADGPAMAMAFEDLLREIDRLRSVSTSGHGGWTRECCGKHSQYCRGFGRFHTHPKQGRRLARRST
jgi:hypothetical protein